VEITRERRRNRGPMDEKESVVCGLQWGCLGGGNDPCLLGEICDGGSRSQRSPGSGDETEGQWAERNQLLVGSSGGARAAELIHVSSARSTAAGHGRGDHQGAATKRRANGRKGTGCWWAPVGLPGQWKRSLSPRRDLRRWVTVAEITRERRRNGGPMGEKEPVVCGLRWVVLFSQNSILSDHMGELINTV
jgi:hypothetical protein